MKSSFFLIALLFSGISFSQAPCSAKITEISDKHQLQAQFTCKPEKFTFTIQDKLGTEVYRTDNPDFMWNEKSNNGTIAPNGDYVYTLNCRFDNEAIKLTGDFTLKR